MVLIDIVRSQAISTDLVGSWQILIVDLNISEQNSRFHELLNACQALFAKVISLA